MIELILLGVVVAAIMCVAYISYRLDIKKAKESNTSNSGTETPPSVK